MRNHFALAAVGSLLISAGLMGCSSGLISSRSSNRDDLSELKRRVLELQEQAAVTEVELDRVRRELALLKDNSAGVVQSEKNSNPNENPVLESLNQSGGATSSAIAVAPIETLESSDLPPRTVEPMALEPIDVEGVELSSPIAELPAQVAAAEENSAILGDDSQMSDQAQELYDRGYTLYHQGRYIDAESSFRRFLQNYPQTELSDNAQYWIGESRYARGDIRSALAAFQETVERYPTGNKVPDAILKLAGCLEELGADEAAQARYDEVIRRFPNSAAASLAEDRRQKSE